MRSLPVDLALVRKHNRPGPRYTSYPTALQFREDADPARLVAAAQAERGGISLYFHLPFCESLCWFCGCNKVITTDSAKADLYLDALERAPTGRAYQAVFQRKTRRHDIAEHRGCSPHSFRMPMISLRE